MPNWVYTDVEIQGERTDIDAFLEKAKTESEFSGELKDGDFFTFHAFITPPADKLEEYKGQHGFIDGKEVGKTKFNWYEWNIANWDTKWDACNPQMIANEGDSTIFTFETAWSPPIKVYEAMAEQHPTLKFNFRYEEEQGWGGTMTFAGGVITDSSDWDIPTCHEDYMNLDKECDVCQGWYVDDPEQWYDDCPNKQEEINNLKNKETQNA